MTENELLLLSIYRKYLAQNELTIGVELFDIKVEVLKWFKEKNDTQQQLFFPLIKKDYEMLEEAISELYKLSGSLCQISKMKVEYKRKAA